MRIDQIPKYGHSRRHCHTAGTIGNLSPQSAVGVSVGLSLLLTDSSDREFETAADDIKI